MILFSNQACHISYTNRCTNNEGSARKFNFIKFNLACTGQAKLRVKLRVREYVNQPIMASYKYYNGWMRILLVTTLIFY